MRMRMRLQLAGIVGAARVDRCRWTAWGGMGVQHLCGTVFEHATSLLMRLLFVLPFSVLRRATLQACALPSVDACDPWVAEGRPKTDCEACGRVANDIHWSLSREQRVNATIVDRTLRVICMEVGMRHDRPMEAEAFCHEHVDEHWKEMNKMLVKVYNDPSVGDKARAVRKRFCGGMTEVCEPERAEWAVEVRAQKEAERAQRMAARKTKEEAKTNSKAKDEL